MNNIYDCYKSITNAIKELTDFKIYDFIYYLGITVNNSELSKEEIIKLIDICKSINDGKLDSFSLARNLTDIVFTKKYMTLEQLERVSSDTIQTYFLDENMSQLRYYFESYSEIVTSIKDIKYGCSYTVARVVDNGYSVELHYNQNGKSTIEYGVKMSYDFWENVVEEIDWFNLKLDDNYVLNKLECMYEEKFSTKDLTDIQIEELNLIDKILYKHKVDDINLHINDLGILVAYDNENFWVGKEFYDFLFDELFVYDKNGKVELIDEIDYKNLKEYKEKYDEKDMEKEEEYEK